ncbi:MAG: GTP-binding protein TypA/BipA [Parcubacteria group bacterium GW2011_GWF2_40_69]|nr:MAG: GTP-binding protein TypA/BipA [Parcubacteria group bacterium GW2011_GWC2_40_10]KKR69056.1 MAG: GTP-binding protein TypA/BipA [Parcubacteria group bacterium GW2011_GWF2_40_69]KKR81638.1 MAG: GTP-binding protein TypA/BipA [Parcubacteria group bacterium GW2011_GWD1_40_9]
MIISFLTRLRSLQKDVIKLKTIKEMEIRNIAIIAHVDHGKTMLTDALMRQTGMVTTEGATMDSNALEQERGITIYAKNTSIYYPPKESGREVTKINIVDTPGHSDFGSEVERVLRSIDTVLLLVDAQEGPMPQTRFVLKKSLELGLKPIVIINKIDKPASRPEEVHELVLELFLELGANDEQLDFTTVYAIGREGIAKMNLADENKDLTPLLETILKEVPPASGDKTLPARLQSFNLAYDNFLGRLAVCRVYEGTIKNGDVVFVKQHHNTSNTGDQSKVVSGKLTKLFSFEGTKRLEITEASAGDIVMIAGLPTVYIGDTICKDENADMLPSINIDEPTISLNFLVNDSPFAGREGKYVTGRQIRERLEKELEMNVGLKIDWNDGAQVEGYTVYGRGELHIAILLENMRREGYELQVSQPKVIIKEKDGVMLEPFEEVTVDISDELASSVISRLTERRGILMNVRQTHGHQRLIFEIPTRGLLGYRGQFIVDTKGLGILSSRFVEFREHVGEIKRTTYGSMVSMESGKVLAFALDNLQQRGTLYVDPGTEVYVGMVIGNVSKGADLSVNPTKGKQLTNMRSTSSDGSIYLAATYKLDIEKAMEIMAEDEYIEITPKSVRLRKKTVRK